MSQTTDHLRLYHATKLAQTRVLQVESNRALRILREVCSHSDCVSALGVILCPRCGASWGAEDDTAPDAREVETATFSWLEQEAPRVFSA
jgi:hypothetical protein